MTEQHDRPQTRSYADAHRPVQRTELEEVWARLNRVEEQVRFLYDKLDLGYEGEETEVLE